MKKAVFLGDSITMGYGLADRSRRYTTVFCESMGYEEDNYGITGTLIARAGVSRGGEAFIDRWQALPPADLAVVFGGANDYWWSDTPIGDECSKDEAYFHCALRHLCEGMKAKYQDTPLLFILPYSHRGYGNFAGGKDFMDATRHHTGCPNFLGNSLGVYCDLLRSVCAQYGIPTLDLYRNFPVDLAGNDDDSRRYTLDGCHPSEAGHRLLAEQLETFVRRL